MQPYFFPYIGYWQLVNAVDKFVVYDDVNYINRGWINRNRILSNGKDIYFNIILRKSSQNKLINEIEVDNSVDEINKRMKTLEISYAKAPFFKETIELVKEIFGCENFNLAGFLTNSIKAIAEYLDMHTEIIISSDIEKNNDLHAQDKIIDICKIIGADEYINPIGGQELYSYEMFDKQGIKLKFLKTDYIIYKQFNNKFIPSLSIIDVLMFNGKMKTIQLLNKYEELHN